MASKEDDSPLKQQLLDKIAEQANELTKANSELREYRSMTENFDHKQNSLSRGDGSNLSRDSQRKRLEKEYRDKFNALEKQLANANSRLNENSKARNLQVIEIEKLNREHRHLKVQFTELQKENQNFRTQLISKDKQIKKLKANCHEDPEPIRQDFLRANSEKENLLSENEELKLKIRVLEDALEFRADEIGLAGHADLLSKIAHFRGEVSALKKDLQSKHVKLESALTESNKERDRNEELNETVSEMKSRLAEAKHDFSRIKESKDLLDQLKTVEAERDAMVDFIQSDMKKSSTISENLLRVEESLLKEQNLRANVEEQFSHTKQQLEASKKKIADLEQENLEMTLKIDEASHKTSRLERQIEDEKFKIEKKDAQLAEIERTRQMLLEQEKKSDFERNKLEQTVRELRAKCHDLELQVSYAQKDNDLFASKNSLLQEEVLKLSEQIKNVEPRLMKIEPEYARLNQEKDAWLSEKEHCEKDIERFRLLASALDELNSGLNSLSSDAVECANNEDRFHEYSLSQKHVMWCGLPSLRRLSSTLYDNIRSMFQDLRKLERDFAVARENFEVDTDDVKDSLKKEKELNKKNESMLSEARDRNNSLSNRLQACEKELNEKRECSAILDNIRIVLKSAASAVIGGVVSSSTNQSQFELSNDDFDFSTEEMNLQELSEKFVVERNSSEGRSNKAKQGIQFVVENKDLPAEISRALARNLDSVTKLVECEKELLYLRDMCSSLQRDKSTLSAENYGLRQSIEDLRKTTDSKHQEYSMIESQSQMSLNQAAELTERQNELISKLEEKLTEFRRKMLLKASQVTSLQQRENTLRKRLCEIIVTYSNISKMRIIVSEDTGMVELVKLVEAILQQDNFVLNDSSKNVGDPAMGNNMAYSYSSNRLRDLEKDMNLQSPASPSKVSGRRRPPPQPPTSCFGN